MFMFFGIVAILFAVCNWYLFFTNRKQYKRFMFLSLSFTALTLCAFYSDAARMVISKDMAGLEDVVVTIHKSLWYLTIASIIINGIPLVAEKYRK